MMIQLFELNIRENVLFPLTTPWRIPIKKGLHDLYSLFIIPAGILRRIIGLGKSFRQYRTDLNWDRSVACCVPDTDCADCRHYAAGSAVVTARLYRHVNNPAAFKSWLDYVDTYLAVWVMGYEKGENLCAENYKFRHRRQCRKNNKSVIASRPLVGVAILNTDFSPE